MLKHTLIALALLASAGAHATVLVSCNGPDDTSAIQAAVNSAETTGDEVVLPVGECHTSAPISITDRVTIRGVGYADDSGAGYAGMATGTWGSLYPLPELIKGSAILPGATDTFDIATNASVHLSDFQISYNQNAASGKHLVAIHLSSAGAGNNYNTRSVLRDISITNADIGVDLTNALEYRIDNVNVLYFWERGYQIDGSNAPSWGDAILSNSTIWGQYVPTGYCSVCILSSGGLRIENNKINVGNGTGSTGILVMPSLTVAQTTEPLVIVGNSIEGQAVGIGFVNANPANAQITEVVITGNQIWSGVNAIRVNTAGTGKWLAGFTVTGNMLMAVGGQGKTVMQIDNATMGVVTGNQFALSGGGTGQGIYFGPSVSGVNVQSNTYASGVTPTGGTTTGNTIGGGSP